MTAREGKDVVVWMRRLGVYRSRTATTGATTVQSVLLPKRDDAAAVSIGGSDSVPLGAVKVCDPLGKEV